MVDGREDPAEQGETAEAALCRAARLTTSKLLLQAQERKEQVRRQGCHDLVGTPGTVRPWEAKSLVRKTGAAVLSEPRVPHASLPEGRVVQKVSEVPGLTVEPQVAVTQPRLGGSQVL